MKNKTSITELQRMTPDELRRDIAMHRVEYAKMRMGVEMQKEKNHALFKHKRKEIARMMTALKMQQASSPAPKAAVAAAPKTEKIEKKASQATKKSVKSPGAKSKKKS